MRQKKLEKLLRLSISGQEVETLLENFGFQKCQAKGSHVIWFREGCEPIVLARHGKEFKKGYLRQIIKVLQKANLLNEKI